MTSPTTMEVTLEKYELQTQCNLENDEKLKGIVHVYFGLFH